MINQVSECSPKFGPSDKAVRLASGVVVAQSVIEYVDRACPMREFHMTPKRVRRGVTSFILCIAHMISSIFYVAADGGCQS